LDVDQMKNLFTIDILHKPRGCKGLWHQVDEEAALRVTKGRGKWLKMKIRAPIQFSKENVIFYLQQKDLPLEQVLPDLMKKNKTS